jgi:hypothetical protein
MTIAIRSSADEGYGAADTRHPLSYPSFNPLNPFNPFNPFQESVDSNPFFSGWPSAKLINGYPLSAYPLLIR